MAVALQEIQGTDWSKPSFRKVWADISNSVTQGLDRMSHVLGSQTASVPSSEPSEKPHQPLFLIWNVSESSTAFLPPIHQRAASVTSTLPFVMSFRWAPQSFISKVLSSIDQEPVEDGFEHPAETIIGEALSKQPDDVIMWLRLLVSEEKDSCVLASVIKCVARIIDNEYADWVYELVAQALEHQDVEVRDAAAQSLELWGTPAAVALLKNHSEAVSWLRDYIGRIILQSDRR
jgi:hypothetical protein